MATLLNTVISSTSHIQLPKGSTAQRPTSPTVGMIRFNTDYYITETYNGTLWWDLTNNVPSDIGLTSSTPAISGTQLAQVRPMFDSGDYYIQPPGQTVYPVYVDLRNQGGGWVMVGSGKQGIYGTTSAWFVDTGSPNGSYATQLTSGYRGSPTVRYLPRDWIRALCQGYTWNSMTGMIINRTQLGDSFFHRTSTSNFSWNYFGGAADVNISGTVAMSFSRYTGQWLSGTNSYNFTNNTNWGDTINAGSPVANDATRLFTWSWSGHSSGGTQYMGFSAGDSVKQPGFQAGTEGHAIQQVEIFVK